MMMMSVWEIYYDLVSILIVILKAHYLLTMI